MVRRPQNTASIRLLLCFRMCDNAKCAITLGARPARKSSRRTNHKGWTVQRVGGGVTNGGGTVRAVGGIEPGSDPWLVASPTTLPRGQSHT